MNGEEREWPWRTVHGEETAARAKRLAENADLLERSSQDPDIPRWARGLAELIQNDKSLRIQLTHAIESGQKYRRQNDRHWFGWLIVAVAVLAAIAANLRALTS